MARRGENIRKRSDGRWEGRYIKGRSAEGKPCWGYVYGASYAEVREISVRKKAEYGDLKVPINYVSPGGYALGKWIKRQRYTRQNPKKSGAVLTEERIEKLDEIGMRREKNNPKHLSEQAVQTEIVAAKAG